MLSVKQRFIADVKHPLLSGSTCTHDNQAMLANQTLAERIRTAIADSGRTKAEIAGECGVTPQALTGWEKTGKVTKNNLARLAELTGKPLEYFLGQQGASLLSPVDSLRPIVEWSSVDDLDPSQHVVLPRLEMYLAAGSGAGNRVAEEPERAPIGQAFRAEFVKRRGWSPKTHYSMLVRGMSMEPTVPDGASVVIDISDRKVRSGMIYAVRIDATSEPILKRLHKLPGGLLRVESDNRAPQFAAFEVRPDDLDGFEIIGRAVNMTTDL
jgi:phage repressor protein C with HTH and peptisase S24 domain